MKMISAALAEDHHVVRQAPRRFLARRGRSRGWRARPRAGPDAGDSRRTARSRRARGLLRRRPGSTRRHCLAVAWVSPRTRALVLSTHANPAYSVVEAISDGWPATSSGLERGRRPGIRPAAEALPGTSAPPLSEETVEAKRAAARADRPRSLPHAHPSGSARAPARRRRGQTERADRGAPHSPRARWKRHRANLCKLRLRGHSDGLLRGGPDPVVDARRASEIMYLYE